MRRWDPFTTEKMRGCNKSSSSENWRCRGFGAAKCSLYQCVRAYEASVKAGRLSESLVFQSDGHWNGQILDTACLSSTQRAYIQSEGYYLPDAISRNESTGRFISVRLGNKTLVTDLFADGCLFRAGTPNIQYSLQSLFDQPVTANYIWGSNVNNVHLRAASFSGAPQLLSIFNNGNISFRRVSGTFSNIADSMTDYVRTHGDPKYSAPAKGIAWHYATCLEVRWQWITFPFALYICTVALLGAVALSTFKSRRPIWKLSLLAWIYHGPARDFGPDSIPGLEVEPMRERAKRHVVVLGGNDDLRIRMVESVKEPMSDTS